MNTLMVTDEMIDSYANAYIELGISSFPGRTFQDWFENYILPAHREFLFEKRGGRN